MRLLKSFLRGVFTVLYQFFFLRQKHVKLKRSVLFNRCTIFEGQNVIHRNANVCGTIVGYGTYIGNHSNLFHSKVGRFCSIGENVRVLPYTHPVDTFVSTHPVFFSIRKQNGMSLVTENLFDEIKEVDGYYCIIGNDVWIGDDVKIIGGITIGNGSIIAAGSIITRDVKPYSIVGGIPGKIIKMRFEESQIIDLEKIKWWDWDIDMIKDKRTLFKDVEEFLKNNKNL